MRHHIDVLPHKLIQLSTAMLAGGVFMLSGCGGDGGGQQASPTAPSGANSNAVTGKVGSTSGSPSPQKPRGRDEVYEDEKGQKWFGKVPYDVFFDKPLEVARDSTSIGNTVASTETPGSGTSEATKDPVETGSTDTASTTPAETKTPDSDPVTPSGAGGSNKWKDVISVAVIDAEVKSIRNFFTENLQSVGNYNSSMLMLPPKAASLGVMAGVAMEHPDAVSWKDDAIYIRDLAKQMNSAPLQRGAKDQKRLLTLFEAVSDTLNRSRPAGLSEPNAADSFPEISEMGLVMARMDEAEKRMKTEAGSQGSFQTNKEMVKHEASILATLTHTVSMPGYGYGDDEKFVGYANNVVDGAKAIMNAAEADDFPAYEIALSKITTNCNACHGEFKND
jgi:hypothetical protein